MKDNIIGLASITTLLALVGLIISFSTIASASTLCDRNSTLSRIFPGCAPTTPPPPPADVCPNVPGNQTSTPCADTQCSAQGGTWNGTSCDMPPVPFPPPSGDGNERNICGRYLSSSRVPIPDSCIPDVCPNVPRKQAEGPCADQQCVDQGGTWDGTACELPPPPPPPFVRITYPNAGETFTVGDAVEIQWEANRITSCFLGHTIGPGSMEWINTNVDGTTGSYSWTAERWGSYNILPQQQKIYLSCTSPFVGTFEDYSDDYFTVVAAPKCSDGIDNDSDSTIDYPDDPNCTSAVDDSEQNPVVIYPGPQDSTYGSISQTGWGEFYVIVTDEPVLLGPISLTITTTGMEQVTKLTNVWLEGWNDTQILAGQVDVPLENGLGEVTFFSNPILLGLEGHRFGFRATIPLEERPKVSEGATITITGNPALHWRAVGSTSGTEISLSSVLALDMGTLLIVGGGAGSGGGGGSATP